MDSDSESDSDRPRQYSAHALLYSDDESSDEEEYYQVTTALQKQRNAEMRELEETFSALLDELINGRVSETPAPKSSFPLDPNEDIVYNGRQKVLNVSIERVECSFLMGGTAELDDHKQHIIDIAARVITNIGINHVFYLVPMPDANIRKLNSKNHVFEGYVIVVDGTTSAKKVVGGVHKMHAAVAMTPIDLPSDIADNENKREAFLNDVFKDIQSDYNLFDDLSSLSPIEMSNFFDKNTHILSSTRNKKVTTSSMKAIMRDMNSKTREISITLGPHSASIAVILYRNRSTRKNEMYLYLNNYNAESANALHRLVDKENITVDALCKTDVFMRNRINTEAMNEILMCRLLKKFGVSPETHAVTMNGKQFEGVRPMYYCPYNSISQVSIKSNSTDWRSTTLYGIYVSCFDTMHIRGGVIYGLGRTCGVDIINRSNVLRNATSYHDEEDEQWEIPVTYNAFPMGAVNLMGITHHSTDFVPDAYESKWNESHVFSRAPLHKYQITKTAYVHPCNDTEMTSRLLSIRNIILGKMSMYIIKNMETCAVYCSGFDSTRLDSKEVVVYRKKTDGDFVRVSAFNDTIIPRLMQRMATLFSSAAETDRSLAWIPNQNKIFKHDERRNDILVHEEFFQWVFDDQAKQPYHLGYGFSDSQS